MSQHDPQNEAARQYDDRLVDDYVRYHFRVEPPSALTARLGEAGQPESTEDEQFEQYMRTHFPGHTPE